MTPRKFVNEFVNQADIGRVRDQLDRTIEGLVERGLEDTGVDQLREAVRLLEGIRQTAASQRPSAAVAAALREIAPRAARAGQLLDSAAAFYRGWLQVSPAPAEDYTPDGAWAPAAPSTAGASLSVEA
jgi:Arc/MetJ-type ribon-helix-helix transcriptional regulator